ncbi:MAG: septation protein IspZ [Chloroflexi bacterium]|nr:septation protein IspZ [Chloroflexota bacterium]
MQRTPPPPDPELPTWLKKADGIPQVDPIAVLGVAPTLAYLIFNAVGGVRAAIAAAVIAGVIVYIVQRRLRPQITVVRWLMVFSVAFNVGFGVWGLIEGDGKVYWARDFIDNFVLGGIFLITVLIGRPVVSAVVRETFPALRDQLPADHRVWTRLTIVWGLYIALAGVLRWWILDQVSAETYALIRLPLGWGMGLVLMLWTFSDISRAIREVALQRGRSDSDLNSDTGSDDPGEVVADAEVAER